MEDHAKRVCILWDDGTWTEKVYVVPNPSSDIERLRNSVHYRKAVDIIDWGWACDDESDSAMELPID